MENVENKKKICKIILQRKKNNKTQKIIKRYKGKKQ